MNIVDALSRLTKIEQAQTRNIAAENIRFVAKTAAPQAITTTEEIEDASAVDEELEYVQQSVETGNWENSNCANYKPVRDELCLFLYFILFYNTKQYFKLLLTLLYIHITILYKITLTKYKLRECFVLLFS